MIIKAQKYLIHTEITYLCFSQNINKCYHFYSINAKNYIWPMLQKNYCGWLLIYMLQYFYLKYVTRLMRYITHNVSTPQKWKSNLCNYCCIITNVFVSIIKKNLYSLNLFLKGVKQIKKTAAVCFCLTKINLRCNWR